MEEHQADIEACQIEHIISDTTFQKLTEAAEIYSDTKDLKATEPLTKGILRDKS